VRPVGGAGTASAAKTASPKDAISQSSYEAGRAESLATLKQRRDNITGIEEEANHLAEGIRIVLSNSVTASSRHPIMHSSA